MVVAACKQGNRMRSHEMCAESAEQSKRSYALGSDHGVLQQPGAQSKRGTGRPAVDQVRGRSMGSVCKHFKVRYESAWCASDF